MFKCDMLLSGANYALTVLLYEAFLFTDNNEQNLIKMIEVRKTTDKEKAKHINMAYVIDLGHTKQWFTEKALVELLGKVQNVVNENDLLQRVSGSNYCKQCKEPIPDGFRFCSGECKQYYYR